MQPLGPVAATGHPPAPERLIRTAALAGACEGANPHNLLDCYRIALDFGLVAARRALKRFYSNRIV
ncbi:MAG: hypothetical protein L0Z68_01455 [Gammaproteobacteria bacterium]|nr:hypothetical protein [Gammaproteobacteria bacterium]